MLANNGFKAGTEWTAGDGSKFKVDLVLIDSPVAMRDAWPYGEVPIGWATLDSCRCSSSLSTPGTLVIAGSCRRIYQQVDFPTAATASWCVRTSPRPPDAGQENGAGAKLAIANMLWRRWAGPRGQDDLHGRRVPGGVCFIRKDISSAVSCAGIQPVEGQGNRMLVTTQEANRLIFDVWIQPAVAA